MYQLISRCQLWISLADWLSAQKSASFSASFLSWQPALSASWLIMHSGWNRGIIFSPTGPEGFKPLGVDAMIPFINPLCKTHGRFNGYSTKSFAMNWALSSPLWFCPTSSVNQDSSPGSRILSCRVTAFSTTLRNWPRLSDPPRLFCVWMPGMESRNSSRLWKVTWCDCFHWFRRPSDFRWKGRYGLQNPTEGWKNRSVFVSPLPCLYYS